jgi:hypothetical protein
MPPSCLLTLVRNRIRSFRSAPATGCKGDATLYMSAGKQVISSLNSAKRATIGDRYLAWHALVLLGYALLGKGFAYVGLPPVYIGEITLALGLVTWSLNRFSLEVFRLLPACLLVAFMFWNGIRTIPYLSQYGLDALRDSASWGYGFFAFIVATLLIAKPERLWVLLDRYRRFAILFTTIIPVTWFLTLLYGEVLPRVPGAPVPIIYLKAGDVLVHLAGIAAFVAAGLSNASLFLLTILSIIFPMVAWWNRGGMLSFLASVSLVAVLSPVNIRLWRLLAIVALALMVLGITGVNVQFPGVPRELSFEQLVLNFRSVTSDLGTVSALEGTKDWRLQWWSKIIDYTFGGDYFWTGKGYGINLADADGFQVTVDHSLRSPHNAHMTFLARAGVPGLVLWVLVQLSWVVSVLASYMQSRRDGETKWTRVFVFLLAYWVALMANATFDVFIEGPMGGIWFWTIYGVGLATTWIYRRYPRVLDQ